jgi:hypothetical protein
LNSSVVILVRISPAGLKARDESKRTAGTSEGGNSSDTLANLEVFTGRLTRVCPEPLIQSVEQCLDIAVANEKANKITQGNELNLIVKVELPGYSLIPLSGALKVGRPTISAPCFIFRR